MDWCFTDVCASYMVTVVDCHQTDCSKGLTVLAVTQRRQQKKHLKKKRDMPFKVTMTSDTGMYSVALLVKNIHITYIINKCLISFTLHISHEIFSIKLLKNTLSC